MPAAWLTTVRLVRFRIGGRVTENGDDLRASYGARHPATRENVSELSAADLWRRDGNELHETRPEASNPSSDVRRISRIVGDYSRIRRGKERGGEIGNWGGKGRAPGERFAALRFESIVKIGSLALSLSFFLAVHGIGSRELASARRRR
jgi:hypothetical protein